MGILECSKRAFQLPLLVLVAPEDVRHVGVALVYSRGSIWICDDVQLSEIVVLGVCKADITEVVCFSVELS